MLAQDLHRDGALPRDHIEIIVGVDEGAPILFTDLQRERRSLLVTIAFENDPRTESFDRIDLDPRRGSGHHDSRVHPESRSRERNALGVIAGRCRHDPRLPFALREQPDLVVGPANLEGEDGLQILTLDPNAISEPLRK